MDLSDKRFTYPSGWAKTVLLAWAWHRPGEIMAYELLADGCISAVSSVWVALWEKAHIGSSQTCPLGAPRVQQGGPHRKLEHGLLHFSVRPLNFPAFSLICCAGWLYWTLVHLQGRPANGKGDTERSDWPVVTQIAELHAASGSTSSSIFPLPPLHSPSLLPLPPLWLLPSPPAPLLCISSFPISFPSYQNLIFSLFACGSRWLK